MVFTVNLPRWMMDCVCRITTGQDGDRGLSGRQYSHGSCRLQPGRQGTTFPPVLRSLHPCRIRIEGLADPDLRVLPTFLTNNRYICFLKNFMWTGVRDSFIFFLFDESPSVSLKVKRVLIFHYMGLLWPMIGKLDVYIFWRDFIPFSFLFNLLTKFLWSQYSIPLQ